MENKKTTELLDLLDKLGELKNDADYEKFDEIIAELGKRWPFNKLFGDTEYSNVEDMTFEERIRLLEEDVKLLKRHKHDDKSGDVLVRI